MKAKWYLKFNYAYLDFLFSRFELPKVWIRVPKFVYVYFWDKYWIDLNFIDGQIEFRCDY